MQTLLGQAYLTKLAEDSETSLMAPAKRKKDPSLVGNILGFGALGTGAGGATVTGRTALEIPRLLRAVENLNFSGQNGARFLASALAEHLKRRGPRHLGVGAGIGAGLGALNYLDKKLR